MSREEDDTLSLKKTAELQRELEGCYKPVSWWRKLLRLIGWFFGLE
jgi:hypothetical protein